jgi:hypothetical protein
MVDARFTDDDAVGHSNIRTTQAYVDANPAAQVRRISDLA